jgi:hypothetical protein
MLQDDPRSEDEADADWHRANHAWSVNHDKFEAAVTALEAPAPPTFSTPTIPQLTDFHAAALSHGHLPPVPFDTSSGFMDFPRSHALYLNTKVFRRILAARESIFKYGIYLPRNDRDADASPERARWHSGRQLEWIRRKTFVFK